MSTEPKARLFCGIMYADQGIYRKAITILQSEFGTIEHEGEEFDFDFTTYYENEFGPGLKKRFVVFSSLIGRKQLPEIKHSTIQIEDTFRRNAKRQINIDPGYITLHNVVVASTKELPHRVYLGEGIYGDVQLILKRKKSFVFRHTFADYAAHKDFFLKQRNK